MRTAELDRAIADAYVTTEVLEADQDPSCVDGVRVAVDRAAAARKALDGTIRMRGGPHVDVRPSSSRRPARS